MQDLILISVQLLVIVSEPNPMAHEIETRLRDYLFLHKSGFPLSATTFEELINH